MKKLLAILFVLLTLCLPVLTSCKDDGIPDGMKYATTQGVADYTLFVPEGWVLTMGTPTATAANASKSDRTGISVQRLSYQSYDEWWTDMRATINENLKDVSVSDKESALIDGVDSVKYTVYGTWGENGYHKLVIYGIKHGDFVYSMVVTYPYAREKDGKKIYTDDYQAENVQKILDNFRFNDSQAAPTEPSYENDGAPQGMKRAGDPDIFDYNFFVPNDWTVQSPVTEAYSTISSAYSYNSVTQKNINVNIMQWNDTSDGNYELWWNEYKLQLDNAFKDLKLSSPEISECQIAGNDARSAAFSASLGENTYNYEVYAVFHRASIHVITFTIKGQDSFDSYKDDINQIISSFNFD